MMMSASSLIDNIEEVKKMTSNKLIAGDRIQNLLSAIPKIFLITLVLLTISFSAKGHVAETDENGCHYDHLDRYHCH